MNRFFRINDVLASVVELGIRLRLLNDPSSQRSSDADGRIYSSYSPSHPKAGQRLPHHVQDELPFSVREAWNDMEPWRRTALSVIMTAAVTGFIIFMLLSFVFPA